MLLIGGAVVMTTWPENYGESNEKVSIAASWRKAMDAIFQGAPSDWLRASQSRAPESCLLFRSNVLCLQILRVPGDDAVLAPPNAGSG